MSLFNRSGEVVLSNGSRKPRARVPAWLMWLGSGVLVGVLGLIWVQDRYGPQRLTVAESRGIVAGLDREKTARQAAERKAEAQAEQSRNALAAAKTELDRARAELQRRINESASADGTIERLRMDLALFDQVMPPDPRPNPVGVRAARLAQEGNRLRYHVLLTRDGQVDETFNGVMQFVVRGNRASGAPDTLTFDAVPVEVGAYQHVQGVQDLPAGFVSRQTTIQVLDKPDGNTVGMRIIHIQQPDGA